MLTSGKVYNHTLSLLSCDKRSMMTMLLALSGVYAVLGGGLELWYPNPWVPVDFNVFYKAGNLARNGTNPYAAPGLTIAYPPAWIALCAMLSWLPWSVAVVLWKLLNLFFLGGSVWLLSRLFGLHLSDFRTKLVFCFACFLWPTLTTLKEGQTSLFVLFFLLCSIFLWREGKLIVAGVPLCLSLVKPQLAAPLFLLFAWRFQLSTVFVALALFLGLSYGGIWLSNGTLSSYLDAISAYVERATHASDPHNIGIQNLSSILLNLSNAQARQLGGVAGVIFMVYLYIRDRGNVGFNNTANLIPLILLSGPLFFGARSYDLVLVIPFFAWILSRTPLNMMEWLAAVSCLALLVPLQAVTMFYGAFLSSWLPSAFLELVLAPFRSWVLLILVVSGLTIYLKDQCSPVRARIASSVRRGKSLRTDTPRKITHPMA
jgi:hypothetical protein